MKKKERKYTLEEIDKAMLSVLPAFPPPSLKEKVRFLVFVWKQAKKALEEKDEDERKRK